MDRQSRIPEVVVVVGHHERNSRKNLIAFWIFGLCNNYGYVVMLTAAIDIIESNSMHSRPSSLGRRDCTPMSTGAILLADIIPSFIIKSLSPFLPYNTTLRILISCLTSAVSFSAVAFAGSKWTVIVGVALTSFASGLGEPTFLAHSTKYNKNCISTWSSGTGGAGVIGALSYSVMREIGLTSRQTLLLMILVPIVELLTYFVLLSKPHLRHHETDADEGAPLINESETIFVQLPLAFAPPLNSFKDKITFIPDLMIYFIPLMLVYFFEYFINQGLFELVTFHNIFLTTAEQYRWYQVTYQIGVFISRSSVNIIQIKRTWIMTVIQGLIATFFLFEAIYQFMPSIWLIFCIIFMEGLQGGLAYVNTYYRMSADISPNRKEFAMSVVASSDSMGIIIAGFLAIPTHNWICHMPSIATS